MHWVASLFGCCFEEYSKEIGCKRIHERCISLCELFGSYREATSFVRQIPAFFRAARFPETYLCNLGYWGLQCGPGWFPAVENAAAAIENELKKLLLRISESSTLVSVDRLLRETCIKHRDDEVVVDEGASGVASLIPFCSEICEEGGALRISLVNGHLCDGATWVAIRSAADRAILRASHLCERCGRPGQYRAGYWCRVYCAECAATTIRI